MPLLPKLTTAIILVTLISVHLRSQDSGDYSAADSLAIAEITLEEIQLNQADFLPLSLAEKGRQSALSWRGMPPGYLDYRFANITLYNPLWGYWDNQHIPLELIRNRILSPSSLQYSLHPVKIRESAIPVTRIAFSQDLQFDLSYLDANLRSYYRPKSYFQLSGNNFKRIGTAGDFTTTRVNTYRGQLHHQISRRWSADLWYWQIRHKFALTTFPVATDVARFSRVAHIGWLNIRFQPDSSQHLMVIPYASKWQDQYHNQDYSRQRKTSLYSAGLAVEYRKYARWWELSILSDNVRHQITRAFVFPEKDQWDSRITADVALISRRMRLELGGGYRQISGLGQSPQFSGAWEWHLPLRINSKIAAHYLPQRLPLSSLWWEGYNRTALVSPPLPLRRGISWQLTFTPLPGLVLQAEPYYNQYQNAPYYQRVDSTFIQRDFDNSGIRLNMSSRLWFMEIADEFNYSDNYLNNFTPRFNNVLKVNLPLSLFRGALRLDNFVIYRFMGVINQVQFDALTNQYVLSGVETGDYHLLDVKFLAHIKTATVFLVWENLLSQDYALVEGYFELYRLFRFGIYWTLFD